MHQESADRSSEHRRLVHAAFDPSSSCDPSGISRSGCESRQSRHPVDQRIHLSVQVGPIVGHGPTEHRIRSNRRTFLPLRCERVMATAEEWGGQVHEGGETAPAVATRGARTTKPPCRIRATRGSTSSNGGGRQSYRSPCMRSSLSDSLANRSEKGPRT